MIGSILVVVGLILAVYGLLGLFIPAGTIGHILAGALLMAIGYVVGGARFPR